MKKKIISVLRFSLFLSIGIFFIWLFLRNLTPEQKHEIIISLGKANYWWIVAAIVPGILSHVVRAVRWKMLLEPLGYQPKTTNIIFSVFIGYLANLALPRLGEVSRCGILTKYEKIPFNKSFGTVITERTIDMLFFILLFFINLAFQLTKLYSYIEQKVYLPLSQKFNYKIDFTGSLTYLVLAVIIILVLLFWIFRKQIIYSKIYLKIRNLILGLLEGMKSLLKIKKPFLFITYTLIIWFLYLMMAYVVFFAMPQTSSLGLDAGFAILIFGSIGIMVVQGGIGIYPAIVAETLFIYSIPETTGYAMGWLIWLSQNVIIVIFGVASTLLLPIYNKNDYGKDRIHSIENTKA